MNKPILSKEQIDQTPEIKTISFVFSINNSILSIKNINSARLKVNLDQVILADTSPALFDSKFWGDNYWNDTLNLDDRKSKYFLTLIDNQVKNIKDSFITIFNQSLIVLCCQFDAFLTGLFETIVKSKEEYFFSKLEKYVDSNGDHILGRTIKESIHKFDKESGIRKKLKILESFLEINVDEIFNVPIASQSFKNKYPNVKSSLLNDLYKKRNDFVHRGVTSINTPEDLDGYLNLLIVLIYTFANLTAKQYCIFTDLQKQHLLSGI